MSQAAGATSSTPSAVGMPRKIFSAATSCAFAALVCVRNVPRKIGGSSVPPWEWQSVTPHHLFALSELLLHLHACMQFHSLLLLLSTEHSAVISSPLTALYGNEAVQLTTADV